MIKSLNDKDIFVTKADKGNSIVIVDKRDYDQRIQDLIDNGPYKGVRNPLNKMKNQITAAINEFIDIFGADRARRIHTTYNRVPRICGLPKIHKPGNKYRRVVSNINAPAYNLSKWLMERFSNMKPFESFSIKNSIELTSKTNDI